MCGSPRRLYSQRAVEKGAHTEPECAGPLTSPSTRAVRVPVEQFNFYRSVRVPKGFRIRPSRWKLFIPLHMCGTISDRFRTHANMLSFRGEISVLVLCTIFCVIRLCFLDLRQGDLSYSTYVTSLMKYEWRASLQCHC